MLTYASFCVLWSPYTSDDYEMKKGASKSTCFEPTMKHLMKETRLGHRSVRNLARRIHNIRVKIYIMEMFTLKAMIGRSLYNTIT